MLKLILAIFCSLCICNSAHSQVRAANINHSLSGFVKDASTGNPLQKATLKLKSSQPSFKTMFTSSDSSGHFNFTGLPAGKYQLIASFSGHGGFSKYYSFSDTTEDSFSNEIILLVAQAKMMKDVTVTGTRSIIENKPDKIVYNVDKDLTSQGGVAIDILRKIPQVTVDANGNVELLGNPSVRFLVNGKTSTAFGNSLADALQSIPASQIQSIEVISSPGAKYDASGTGGIINIILKKSRLKGFSGILNLTAGSRLENGSLNLTYKKNNFGMTGYFSGSSQLKTITLSSLNRNSVDTASKHQYNLMQDGSSDFSRFGYRSGLSADWDINNKNSLSFSLSAFRFGNKNTGNAGVLNTETDQPGNLLFSEKSNRFSNTKFDNSTYEVGLDYRRKMKKDKEEFSFSLNQGISSNNSAYLQSKMYPLNDSIFAGSSSKNPGRDYLTEISVDYSNPISENFLLETGLRSQIEKLESNSDVFTFNRGQYKYLYDDKQSYTSVFRRQVIAGYVSVSFKLFKALDVIAGARLEHTFNKVNYSKNTSIKIPDYNNLGPALTLSHSFMDRQSIRFSYAYRLERPEYRDLNPFVNLSDPHNISTGNPYIQPEIGNELQLAYNRYFGKDMNLNLVLVYNYNSPDIKTYTTFYPIYKVGDSVYADVNVTMRDNIAAETRWGANITISVNSVKNLNLRLTVQLYDRTTKNIYSNPVKISGFEYRGNMNVNYQFKHGLVAEAFGNYNSGLRWQGRRAAFSSYTFAVRKPFIHGKGSIGLTAVNAFGKYLSQKSTQTGTGFSGNTLLKIPYRSFGISFMYKFGKIKITKPKEEENLLTKPPSDNQ